MSVISEEDWRRALTEILEDLDEQQHNKMLILLSGIPKSVKTKSREEMPQAIIEHYGVETSVHKINDIMKKIPRMDAAVQDRLRPFVDQLRNKQEAEKKGQKRKHGETDSESEDETPEADWRRALTEILEDLDEQQYNKMLILLSGIPKSVKTKSREEMPRAIIEHYGVETSVHKINDIMKQIPRNDAAVQDRLRPFVDKPRNTQAEKTGQKRKPRETDSESEDGTPEAGKIHFVDKHMPQLIQRVSNIGPILDELLHKRVIQQEACDTIMALPTSQGKMRALYGGPLKAGSASKDAFYRILQKHEKMLIEDLLQK